MPTIASIAADLLTDPAISHHGRIAIEDHVAAQATAQLGLPDPGHLPADIPGPVAHAVRKAVIHDLWEWEDDNLDDTRQDTREYVRALTRQIADKQRALDEDIAQRDREIRKGLAIDITAADLAADADLKPARIYQIRDERR